MIGEPCLPGGVDVFASLQDGSQSARASTMHEPEMAPVRTGEELEHGPGLPVRAHAEDHAFIGPFHAKGLARKPPSRKPVPSRALAAWRVQSFGNVSPSSR